MQHQILGDNDCPILEIYLNAGEAVKIERGSMAYMCGVELQGKMNSGSMEAGLEVYLVPWEEVLPAEKVCLLPRQEA